MLILKTHSKIKQYMGFITNVYYQIFNLKGLNRINIAQSIKKKLTWQNKV